MKPTILFPAIFLLTLFSNRSFAQQNHAGKDPVPPLGQFWFVMYSKGPGWNIDSTSKQKKDREHIDYIMGLMKEGKFITGGFFPDNGAWTGILIYNSKTREEVVKLSEGDPIVSSKIVSYEIHPYMTIKGTVKFE